MNLLLFPQHIALGGCLKPVTKHGRCRDAWPSFLQAVHSLGNTVTWKDKGLTRGPGFPSKPDAPWWLGGSMDDGYDTGDKNVRLVSGADEET